MDFLTTILAFAVTLGILVIIHEYGHYKVARLFGVKVLRFSIGFGKPIFTWKNKKDPEGTEWSVASIPLGGYVRMLDERDEKCLPIVPADKNKTFNSKKAWQKLLIVLAGPFANLFLAALIYAGLFMYGTQEAQPVIAEPAAATRAADAGFAEGDRILSIDGKKVETFSDMRFDLIKNIGKTVEVKVLTPQETERTYTLNLEGIKLEEESKGKDPLDELGMNLFIGTPTISKFVGNSAARRDGMLEGDKILTVSGEKVRTPSDFVEKIKHAPGKKLEILVESKDGKQRVVEVTPTPATLDDGTVVGKVGASITAYVPLTKVSYGFFESLYKGVEKTWDTVCFSLEMVAKMITGEVSVKNLSGPVTIADYAGQTARLGALAFFSFLALVSISLGVLNLLPIPMLDGAHVMYYFVEILRGKPVSEKFQETAARVGMGALLCLTALALFNDVTRLMS